MDLDSDALRTRYQLERTKRIRTDGMDQYLEPSGDLARFAEVDPFVDDPFTRDPIVDDKEIVIIGGGHAGLLTAARLRKLGFDDLRIIDDASDFGGTWYWNRYPGAQCDIESYIYLPMLEETGNMPTEKYAHAPEIYANAQQIGRHFGLYELACFRTRVVDLRWDETARRWLLRTNRNDLMRARFVVMATGPACRPKLPGIPGIQDFRGCMFHTSRWRYDYTGGDNSGNLHELREKRVAIIGTGCTAIQVIPHLAASAKELLVFQRTPSVISARDNEPTDAKWVATLLPGWQKERRENFDAVMAGQSPEVCLVQDGWTDIKRALGDLGGFSNNLNDPAEAERAAELADFRKMNQVRARVAELVRDPETAEMLKPYYRLMCKRPTFHDEYLQSYNRPNVKLIDTSASQGVERITAHGIVANGVERPVDCIILSTGFETADVRKRVYFDVHGVGGRSLFEHWRTGIRTLHGHSSHGFPNLFSIGLSQNGVSFNMTAMFEEQTAHIAWLFEQIRKRGATRVEATAEGESAWVREVLSHAPKENKFRDTCTPGYFNNEGRESIRGELFNGGFYSPGLPAFNEVLRSWRKTEALQGIELK